MQEKSVGIFINFLCFKKDFTTSGTFIPEVVVILILRCVEQPQNQRIQRVFIRVKLIEFLASDIFTLQREDLLQFIFRAMVHQPTERIGGTIPHCNKTKNLPAGIS